MTYGCPATAKLKVTSPIVIFFLWLTGAFGNCLPTINAAENTAAAPNVIANFRDIPGISEVEIDLIKSLKIKYPQGFVYGMQTSSELFYHDGKFRGFTARFCEYLSTLFDIPFVPKTFDDFSELIADLRTGKVNFCGELSWNIERQSRFLMTATSISTRNVKCFYLHNQPSPNDPTAKPLWRALFLSNTITAQQVSSVFNGNMKTIFVDGQQEALDKLKKGEADVFFDEAPSEFQFVAKPEITTEIFFPLIYSPVMLTTGQSELAPIITAIDRLLASNHNLLSTFYDAGWGDFLQYKFRQSLSAEELEYYTALLAVNRPLKVAMEHDNYPNCFWNPDTGEWQGIVIDVLKKINAITDLSFTAANGTDSLNFSELLGLLDTGQADFICGLIKSKRRERYGYIWADPYVEDRFALISAVTAPNYLFNDIKNLRVGVQHGTGFYDVFIGWFANHPQLFEFSDTKHLLDALRLGKIDLAMASVNRLSLFTHFLEQSDCRINITFPQFFTAQFGFTNENALLCSLISKAMRCIDTDLLSTQWLHKVSNVSGTAARARLPYLMAAVVCITVCSLLLLSFVFRLRWSKKLLNRQIMEATHEVLIQKETAERNAKEAQSASQAKTKFLSQMSHEIRTPLNAIIGVTDSMLKIDNKMVLEASVGMIKSAGKQLLNIVNDILDIQKIENKGFELTSATFFLRESMMEIAAIIDQSANGKLLKFTTNVEQLPNTPLQGDKLRLTQVLMNLLSNAIKFTPEDGAVSFTVNELATVPQQVMLEFVVSDTGIGIEEQKIIKLFGAFETDDSQTTTLYDGIGLGLTIADHIVRKMHGQIKCVSEIGKGSTFSFSVSLFVDQDAQLVDTQVLMPDLSGKRLMIVDDVIINRYVLQDILSESNAEIDECENGEIAVQKFTGSASGVYTVIFMDIRMPKMDGHCATRAIRASQHPDAKTVPIIAVTANAYPEDMVKAKEAGMNAFIPKPVDREQLIKELIKLFPPPPPNRQRGETGIITTISL